MRATRRELLRDRGVNKIVSSLVFHQVPLEEKVAGLAAMRAALVPGGELHVADYGLQRTRLDAQAVSGRPGGDGYENTEPNARGVLPELMTPGRVPGRAGDRGDSDPDRVGLALPRGARAVAVGCAVRAGTT